MASWRIVSGVKSIVRQLARRPSRPSRKPVIGLALGGGFARGLAHIGVLKVLEENRIPIDAIAGVSVGSIIGGAYASGMSVAEMTRIAGSIRFKDFATWTVSRLGFASNARMEQLLQRYFKKTTFEELRIPLAVIATDITDGEQVVFRSGGLVDPVRASCAYPGLFLPIRIGNRTLIDGGFSCPVPTDILSEMGATHIIAVYLICNPFPGSVPTNVFQMVAQCFNLLQNRAGAQWRRSAHCVIEPPVSGYSWDSFEMSAQLIAAGEQAARAMLPRLQSWFERGVPRPALAYSRSVS